MNRKLVIIIALQAFLIVMLFWVLVFYGKDEYEAYTHRQGQEVESPNYLSKENGATVVVLSPETQKQSDIKSSVLIASSHQGSITSYGSVIGLNSLIDLRTRYLAAKAEAGVVRASQANNQQDYQRLLQLNQDNRNISDRAVTAAKAALKSDEAKITAAETTANNLRDSMRQQWGEVLTRIAIAQPSNNTLKQLIEYQDVLVQITLPFDATEPREGSTLTVSPIGEQGKNMEARFISRAPQTDSTIQGKTYFYRASAKYLRVGMRVGVRMDDAKIAQSGVIVPASTVVWYGGKPWVYHKQGADRFIRTPINTEIEVNEGWFNTDNLKPGDEIVTSGAQLLLSEEFKSQIKNENED